MSTCPETFRAQDYLDGELVPAERTEFEAHLAGCQACAAEVAAYAAVFERLAAIETWEPAPGLADRVLAEVMPQHPSRALGAALWGAGVAVAASGAAIAAAWLVPGPRAWMSALVAAAAHSVTNTLMFVVKAINGGGLELLDALGRAGGAVARFASLGRALAASLAQPAVAFTLWAALVAGVAVLWWMRPREDRSVREDHHVGILGF